MNRYKKYLFFKRENLEFMFYADKTRGVVTNSGLELERKN